MHEIPVSVDINRLHRTGSRRSSTANLLIFFQWLWKFHKVVRKIINFSCELSEAHLASLSIIWRSILSRPCRRLAIGSTMCSMLSLFPPLHSLHTELISARGLVINQALLLRVRALLTSFLSSHDAYSGFRPCIHSSTRAHRILVCVFYGGRPSPVCLLISLERGSVRKLQKFCFYFFMTDFPKRFHLIPLYIFS